MISGPTPSTDAPLTHADLAWAHPLVQEWFLGRFGSPTEPQIAGWPAILRGEATLISAPTGSGKTLAAFLVCIDKLLRLALEGALTPHTHVVYVSPLKALSNDVQKNLDGPLAEIRELALQRGYLCPEIRTGVRTGDTLQKERTAMLKQPPHILVTTPESLYILLTAGKPRENLRRVQTVIVDEIHAIADDKRGAHLALTLERLDALVCGENRLAPGAMLTGMSTAPQRIGLSATQNPIELVADFLVGGCDDHAPRARATIVQVGQRRKLDLAIEVPSDELGSITSTAMREEMFSKLAEFAMAHRSTLVFVNTRALVEKISFELAERLGADAVAAHHGSLSRALRLDAEQRLKNGEIRILVATASLELGIDIGNVDLVCQIATTRSVAVAMQRVGRAGHWRGAVPKGRFFALTRDDLMEQAALLRKMVAGELDLLEVPPAPVDVLMQQLVAMCGAESWNEDQLFDIVRRAHPYRNLTLGEFDELLALLHNGIENSRGRYGAYVLRDRVQGQVHARRGSRMIAISNGGAIPDTSLFSVMLQPENVQIATLDEHFAVDSSPGDVVLLGNTSWRIQRIDPAGKVLVEDAHGAPPSIPFWEGEAPQRTGVLSDAVSDLREEIDQRTRNTKPSEVSASHEEVAACIAWMKEQCFVNDSAALQLISYVVAGRAVLGAVPTKKRIIAERFFDEGGGQQLILHAPFGGRLNKAWGLALRKRFCRGFNFELQAAATDNGINISLAEQHSFPLAEVFQFLSTNTARGLLEQAAIPSPLFKNRWRWAAGRSLQLLRMQKGKRVAPQIQRSRSDDLLASVFPHASACPETMTGDIEIPDHPLVNEVMRDTLCEGMDIYGLEELLQAIAAGEIECLAVDTPVPSQFAHELVNAMPYAFLDPEDAAARRTRAVSLRRSLPDSVSDGAGRLDQAAIDAVRAQLWPDVRNEHELHDLLLQLVALPVAFLAEHCDDKARAMQHWPLHFAKLHQAGRAFELEVAGERMWFAAERLDDARTLWPEAAFPEVSVDVSKREFVIGGTEDRPAQTLSARDAATLALTQGWLQMLGPVTASSLGARLHLAPRSLHQAFLAMELQGLAMRGVFEHPRPSDEEPMRIEWCERRILQRIHRLTLRSLREQIEPVTAQVFMRWLLDWQHIASEEQLSGEEGVLAVLEQLEGFEAPACEWERNILPRRVKDYDPRFLDNLCLAGIVGWGRFSPHPAWTEEAGNAPRRVIPTSAAPITFYLRESAEWLPEALAAKSINEELLARSLSAEAQQMRALLAERGAAFSADLQQASGLTKQQVMSGLWELATAGLASADGFDPLRAMMDPRRKSMAVEQKSAVSLRKRAAARTTTGRWSLLFAPVVEVMKATRRSLEAADDEQRATMIAKAKQHEAALDAQARILLCRYGVLFRDLLARESNAPKWRDLVPVLRRLEARGEIRGGRFVSGAFGEQFALPEAVDALRAARRKHEARKDEEAMTICAADPLNLVDVIVPGVREAAIPGREVSLQNGMPPQPEVEAVAIAKPRRRSLVDVVRADLNKMPMPRSEPQTNLGLFS
ncbi:DEAD/DEAH box helicase [Granulicella cerasi]|uniref:DEAD/DEAH box helicase n=1 Tax=Granulicella cerasi TaxID=741063 RepID=A0ABW1ZBU7_9BACT|nr:DEAD/DEAH box helicase [Granulicella cerasi]